MAGVDNDITIVKGLCQETLPNILSQNPKLKFALLDTDQYAGTKGGLDCIVPTISTDAIIVVDDTTVHGVNNAIEETLREFPGLARFPTV
jgi:predicted O-methyltransferase YrrM